MELSSRPSMTPQQAALSDASKSAVARYRNFAVGDTSWAFWVYYECLMTTLSGLPGVLGFGARAMLYPTLFRECGTKPAIGRGVVIRNPAVMKIGAAVMVDDYAVLDARGTQASLELGDHVSIGRFSTLAAKGGRIALGAGVNIGSYCRVATQSRIEIGPSVLVAAYCYIGPGNHDRGETDKPLIERPMEIKGGVTIGEHAWIGAHSTILDGVTIGSRAIVGAHSLVRDDVPDGAVVAGVPAKRIG